VKAIEDAFKRFSNLQSGGVRSAKLLFTVISITKITVQLRDELTYQSEKAYTPL